MSPSSPDVVSHERDPGAVAPERCARQRQPPSGVSERLRMPSPHARSSPAWWTSSRITIPSAASPRSFAAVLPHRHLLVGGDQAVDVTCEALAGTQSGSSCRPDPMGGERPLDLQVAGRAPPRRACVARRPGWPGHRRVRRSSCRHRAWRRRGSRGRGRPGTLRTQHAARGGGSRSASAGRVWRLHRAPTTPSAAPTAQPENCAPGVRRSGRSADISGRGRARTRNRGERRR